MSQTDLVPPPGKREQTKAANRLAILDAARAVFAEMGYGATTVRDIIRRTGLASGTFYNYFKSKEEVFQAIMDESALRIRPRLREEREKAKTFEEFLLGMFTAFFSYVLEDNREYQMMRANTGAIRVRMDTPEVIAGFEELRVDIDEGVERGVIPPVDAEYLTASLIGIAFEMADRIVKRDNPDAREAARFATGLVIGGISKVSFKG
jgi:AcrR family transcriptional regulator